MNNVSSKKSCFIDSDSSGFMLPSGFVSSSSTAGSSVGVSDVIPSSSDSSVGSSDVIPSSIASSAGRLSSPDSDISISEGRKGSPSISCAYRIIEFSSGSPRYSLKNTPPKINIHSMTLTEKIFAKKRFFLLIPVTLPSLLLSID